MNPFRFVYVNSVIPAVGVGVAVDVTCFMSHQQVLMADGTWKQIGRIRIGDEIQGRWQTNVVRGIERPILGDRSVWLINGVCWNTFDHPAWTKTGWQVIDKEAYITNDWEKSFTLYDDEKSWEEVYRPAHPDRMGEFEIGHTELAFWDGGFEPLVSLVEDTGFHPDTPLFSLAVHGDGTQFVDKYCFSAWANERTYDYDRRVGT